MSIVYRNIEAERIKVGMKREEVAVVAGVSLKTYNNWLRCRTEVPASKVSKLAEFFKVSTDYLLERYEVDASKQA